MRNYLKLVAEIVREGEPRQDRTGVGTKALFFRQLSFDMNNGFPATTVKELKFNSVAAELAGFLQAKKSAADFRELGTKIWDANANAKSWQSSPWCKGEDDMGRVYGVQWREWRSSVGEVEVDQLRTVLDQIKMDPYSRRHCVTAWNPGELDIMCLPPCHLYFQYFVRSNYYLDVFVVMRSVDMFLGMPFDIASYALLLHLSALDVGLKPGKLHFTLGDAHVYDNHREAVSLMLSRKPKPNLPKLIIEPEVTGVDSFLSPIQSRLDGYEFHPHLKARMNP